MKHYTYILVWIASLLLSACQFKLKPESKSSDDTDIKVCRYDKLLMDYLSTNSFSSIQKMNTDYPLETKYLLEDVLSIGTVDDPDIHVRLRNFFADSTLMKLNHDAMVKFEDMSNIEKQFTEGFRELKKEVPTLRIPLIYSQLSALNQSVVVIGDSIVGFSIDKYMGADYPLYKPLYYDYQSRYMNPSRIVPDCLLFYLQSNYPFDWTGDHTFSFILMHYGKLHWVIAKVLKMPLDEELGYSKFETQWANENRERVWTFMNERKQLESFDPMLIRSYMRPSFFTRYFGEKSPDRLGLWLGIHLVDEYMKKNPQVTVKELLEDFDYDRMLNEAIK